MKVSDLADATFRIVFGAGPDAPPVTQLHRDNWLQAANHLLESWANDVDLNYTRTIEALTTAGSALSYTIGQGVGADFNEVRPLRVVSAHFADTSAATNSMPLDIIPEYGKLMELRARTFSSGNPIGLYYRPDYPNGTLMFVAAPDAGDVISLEYVATLTQFATLATTVAIPDGLARAIIYNMAVQMGIEYGKPAGADVMAIAAEARANIARVPTDHVAATQRQQPAMPSPAVMAGGNA